MSFKKPTFQQAYPYLLAIGGAIGFFMAFLLTVEKIELLKNPAFIPSCNLNPVLSCGNIMKTSQASVFGFANALIGIGSFAVITTIGMGMLAGAKFKRWFWLGLQAGTIFGVGFVAWLIDESLYSIGFLCPYCMVVWTVTIPIFWYTTLYNLRAGHIKTPPQLKRLVAFCQRNNTEILMVTYLIIVLMIAHRFWYFWSTVL